MLTKLWNGNYSLAKTYWLFYVLIWGIFSIPIRWFDATNEKLQTEYVQLVMFSLCLFVAYGSIVLVGLWRSASKYDGRRLWAILAKIIVCIGVTIQVLTILAVGVPSPSHGIILFVSAVSPLVAMHLLQTRESKKYVFIGIALVVLLISILLVGLGAKSSEKSKWMPITKYLNLNYSKNTLDNAITYLDFSSIKQLDGRRYAYVANEFFEDGVFTNSAKQYIELECSMPARFRVLKVIVYKGMVENGFGEENGRNDDVQATLAKSAVTNGQAYTGGWDTYDTLRRDEIKYCETLIPISKFDENNSKSMCSSTKRDLAVLKTVCENR